MCGIFAYLGEQPLTQNLTDKILIGFNKTQHRGPDNTTHLVITDSVLFGFHRLAINDLSESGNQPFVLKNETGQDLVLICNGEIYNYKQLATKHNCDLKSGSDCEIILHLYKKYGFVKTIEMLNGVFACVLYDTSTNITYVARDPIGVRPLYMGSSNNGSDMFCSELKGISELCETISQFPPGYVWDSQTNFFTPYKNSLNTAIQNHNLHIKQTDTLETIKTNIKEKLINAVKTRLISDRPIGCLLSGGLDSSLIAAILSKLYAQSNNKKLKTFSVGLEGAEDLKYAKLVAEFIDSDHTELILSEKAMLAEISNTVYQLETYDTTTIRAGTPMFILSNYIKQYDSDGTTVIYTGEGSDEASGSYLYFHNAPDSNAFHTEILRLMSDLHCYDVLRCDRSISGAGLEARVPFLDLDFLQYYLNIDPLLKMPNKSKGRMEKQLLREAFDDGTFLPHEVLWRVKEGMSDGVSSKKRGWFQIIQEHTDKLYSDKQFTDIQKTYDWNPPKFKESLWYRELFNKHFPNNQKDKWAKTVPYYWLPKWSGDSVEPSARVLNVYNIS